ncbi:malonyl-CoA decarboxylase [Varunaivibrio sulfuroxidans]|uniref:Malonyl-CoA decarboxylase n=1 Tax=Varunaivibrio sulfuroxidans TaxID=1773489 RepID=A0A4R3JE96_9PROT|nr:malonyl-CoA decarboxylase [Varunaivibrio sulfuroxidans]TCS64114.1 malonyl-CoA decarboxylase [Varunaivibrio sulfuroxidans]WES31438.1 malonyl-CoA decarboxylase [Varunaivibrio sulfuroxidans]
MIMLGENKFGFFDSALKNMRGLWKSIASSEYDAERALSRPDLPEDDAVRLRQQMQACLESRGTEVKARARAAALGRAYLALDGKGRERFLRVLADEFDIDSDALLVAVEAFRAARNAEDRWQAEYQLRRTLKAPRVRLLTLFNALPEGVKFLVDMRAELIVLARHDPSLRALEHDLRDLLISWFDIDFLELRRITWDGSPAAVLEKLMVYEAVHAIESWDDLKNRLDSDRRCFAYFHPRMPAEPLIFVEVALMNGLAGNIQDLLDENAPVMDPEKADTAIFYSISNAQKGLAGISFGNFLIKRVAETLSGELKGLKNFATLSPLPGFRAWLDLVIEEEGAVLLSANEKTALEKIGGDDMSTDGDAGMHPLGRILARADWAERPAACDALKTPLLRLAARYLIEEKGKNGRALDPVAHFHLSNGARMERLNWLGDRSQKGLEQSAGIMINYAYRLSDVESNHDAYSRDDRVAAAGAVRALLKT